MSSPMALSLQHLRELGYDPWVVERDIPARPKPIKRDLLNLADIEAFAPNHTLYVQATTAGELQDHLAKAMHVEFPRLKGDTSIPRLALKILTACEIRAFEIWAWSQAARGKSWNVQRLRAVPVAHRFGFVVVGEGGAESGGTPMDGDVQSSGTGGWPMTVEVPVGQQLAAVIKGLHAMRPWIKGDPDRICATLDKIHSGTGNEAALAELIAHVKTAIRAGCAFRAAVDSMEAQVAQIYATAGASGEPS